MTRGRGADASPRLSRHGGPAMTYTLGQLKKRLHASIHAYGVTDVRDAVKITGKVFG